MRLQNFKCFEDSQDIRLGPLTVIFGRNNTGKSSILQSLLLLSQTLDAPEHGPRLNLRGPLYPAGTFTDIVHQHRSDRHIVMTFGVGFEESEVAAIELEFASDEPQSPRLTRLRIQSSHSDTVDFHRTRGAGGPFELSIGDQSLGRDSQANFRFPVNRFIPLIGTEPPQRGRPNEKRERTRKFASRVLSEFERTLGSMRAVGAFRHQPTRRYEYQGKVPELMDLTGDNVVNALIEDMTRRGRKRGELFRNVNRWLRVMGRVRLMPLRRISRVARIFEIRIKDTDSGRWANFADVGFGIGQALPVFVQGLRTPEGGTFIVQEPEMHLHPDAQLRMADFLVSLARTGRRVIAETHSEHLLLRIRRSFVSSENGQHRLKPSEVSVIYVDKNLSGASSAHTLEIDDLGQVTNWPAGFMEEATDERLAIMSAMAQQTGE